MHQPDSAEALSEYPANLLMAGFDCACHRTPDGARLDVLASTGHDRYFREDYAAAKSLGLSSIRDGVRWHRVESSTGRFDMSSVVPVIRAAHAIGLQVTWDLLHYGWPDHVDILSSSFPRRFAAFASFFAKTYRKETSLPLVVTPITEISYLAWLAGNRGLLTPATARQSRLFKRQLVQAFLAAVEALRAADQNTCIVTAEPLISITTTSDRTADALAAQEAHEAQFEACDMVVGRLHPHLGGSPEYVDRIGVNFYPWNQWLHGPSLIEGRLPISESHSNYRPLRSLLTEVHRRYRKPLIVTETSCEGDERHLWLRQICEEVRGALSEGIPVEGICWYPALTYLGWNDGRRCDCGIWDEPTVDGHRPLFRPLADELRVQASIFARDLRAHGPDLRLNRHLRFDGRSFGKNGG